MVNSVHFGLSTRVNNIEEAVFFLGLRQIRELSMAMWGPKSAYPAVIRGLDTPWDSLGYFLHGKTLAQATQVGDFSDVVSSPVEQGLGYVA